MPLRNLVWLLIVPGLVGLGLAIGFSARRRTRTIELVRQVVEVLAEVDANFVRELTDDERQKLVEDMINGGLHETRQAFGLSQREEPEAVRNRKRGELYRRRHSSRRLRPQDQAPANRVPDAGQAGLRGRRFGERSDRQDRRRDHCGDGQRRRPQADPRRAGVEGHSDDPPGRPRPAGVPAHAVAGTHSAATPSAASRAGPTIRTSGIGSSINRARSRWSDSGISTPTIPASTN